MTAAEVKVGRLVRRWQKMSFNGLLRLTSSEGFLLQLQMFYGLKHKYDIKKLQPIFTRRILGLKNGGVTPIKPHIRRKNELLFPKLGVILKRN